MQKDHKDQRENRGVPVTKSIRTGQKPDDSKNPLDPEKGEEQVDEGETPIKHFSMRADCDLFLDPQVENTSTRMDPEMDPYENDEIQESLPEISEVDVLESMLTHMHYNLDSSSHNDEGSERIQGSLDTPIEDITQEIDDTQNLAYKQMKDGITQFKSGIESIQVLELTDEYHSQVYSSALDSKEEHPIWSILTDNLSYVKDKIYEGSGFKPSEGYEFRNWKGKRDLTLMMHFLLFLTLH